MTSSSFSAWRHGTSFGPAAFGRLTFTPGRDLGKAGEDLVTMLAKQVERVAVATVIVNGLDDGMREWLEKDRGVLPHIDALVGSEALRKALPNLVAGGEMYLGTFKRLHPLLLAGSLAVHLYEGGAYTPLDQCSAAEAARLADAFVHETIGGRYEQFHASCSVSSWSDWFLTPDMWNATWIITDTSNGHTVILCCSDND